MTTKVCKKCYQEKDVNMFHKHKSTKDGLNYYCKECRKITDTSVKQKYSQRTLKWKEQNPEKWDANLKRAKKTYYLKRKNTTPESL
jgi:superfamily II helicase